ncbi:MAG: hypothetical protein BM557_01080 [Flavobacterium sp. MedPE-SWcel]|uniref:OmpH family outer membrane protein n=1 Tax=uncultured Flavobacterium sp. TaxID=165435 RepID=UPI000923701B|nr:OmpH family outer membrane protein [uncultured Flavobacterium sp.]OIQ22606.1 MAG: hypothetical protein BM557_01080 [Flavobacterium sp. MedPE-SWcel]
MKKIFLVLFTAFAALTATAQRGLKVAYIDMEYILNKVPDYAEAKNQLEQKAQKWTKEIETKRNEINKLKSSLKAEKALLTKELIEEREEEIAFQEKEMIDYQQKRFGPTGDLISQKSVLVKPIQDQVFTIIQDLSETRKYDFVFDKSSDLTILFAKKRHDISDLIVRRLTRASKQKQLSSKEVKELDALEAKEELESDPEYQARKKKQDDRKEARQRILDERKAAKEAKRKEYQEKREAMLKEKEAKRNAAKNKGKTPEEAVDSNDDPAPTPQEKNAAKREAAKEAREKKLAERKKAAQERRDKILAERAAAKKAREEAKKKKEEETEEVEDTPNE